MNFAQALTRRTLFTLTLWVALPCAALAQSKQVHVMTFGSTWERVIKPVDRGAAEIGVVDIHKVSTTARS